MGKDFMAKNPGKYALVFNQTEPFWFVPGWAVSKAKFLLLMA
jgi:hypothetical protein